MTTRRSRTRVRSIFALSALVIAGCAGDDPLIGDSGAATTSPAATASSSTADTTTGETSTPSGTTAATTAPTTAPATTEPATTTASTDASTDVATTTSSSTTSSTTSSSTTTSSTTTASTTLPETTAPPSTSAPAPLTIGTATAVAATGRGVLIDDGSNTWDTVVFDDTSARGLALLIDDRVVYQPATTTDVPRPVDGFVVISDDGPESLYGEDGRRVTVFDVGHVDGRATILAQSAVDRPATPADADGELVLIDVLTLERTILRTAGGFESGYTHARFGAGAISAIFSRNASNVLEILERDGTVRHEIELPADTNLSLLDFDESVWVLEPDFVGDEFDPVVGTLQYELATGEGRRAVLPLVPVDGLRLDTGFCDVADFLDGRLVCDRSQGAPILIDVDVDDAATSEVPGIAFGTVRFRASQ